MSNQNLYRCKRCNNSVYTDEHGCECTSSSISYLYHCPDCGLLAQLWEDIRLLRDSKEISKENARWYLPSMGSYAYTGNCPICGSPDIRKWNPIDNSCHKCGGDMIRDDSIVIHTD